MKKQLKLLALLVSCVLFVSITSAKAEPKTITAELIIDELVTIVNGEPQIPMMFAPFIENGRAMVPTNFLNEAFMLKIDWEGLSKIITLTNGKTVIELQTNNKTVKVNGKEVQIDSPPIIRNGRTAYPIRFIMETFGATVTWDSILHKATIVYELPEE